MSTFLFYFAISMIILSVVAFIMVSPYFIIKAAKKDLFRKHKSYIDMNNIFQQKRKGI